MAPIWLPKLNATTHATSKDAYQQNKNHLICILYIAEWKKLFFFLLVQLFCHSAQKYKIIFFHCVAHVIKRIELIGASKKAANYDSMWKNYNEWNFISTLIRQPIRVLAFGKKDNWNNPASRGTHEQKNEAI